jgi:hypothetical protein
MIAIGKQKGMGIVQVVECDDGFLSWDVWVASKNSWKQGYPFAPHH